MPTVKNDILWARLSMGSDEINYNAKQKSGSRITLLQSLKSLRWWFVALIDLIADMVPAVYSTIVRKMFWGRGSLYKSSAHLLIATVAITVLISGVTAKLQLSNVDALSNGLVADLFETTGTQGTNIQAAKSLTSLATFSITTHTVLAGETLDTLATKYKVSKDTIKWSNSRILSPYNDGISVGSQLTVPDFDGVLYEVRSGDSFDSILSLTSGDRKTVIDVNGFGVDTTVAAGQFVFVPGGKMPPPPPLGRAKPARGGYLAPTSVITETIGGFPLGFFDSPLTHPQCGGFRFNRGINTNINSGGYHTGTDWAKSGGCPIRAIAAGRVVSAGYLDSRAAYSIIIDHGNGIQSHYYHGLQGSIWVKVGQQVEKGDDIMYMGNTGNSRGTHLHITLKNGPLLVDPQKYIPF